MRVFVRDLARIKNLINNESPPFSQGLEKVNSLCLNACKRLQIASQQRGSLLANMQTKNKERLRNLGQWHPYLALRSALSLVSSTLGKSRGSCLRRSVSSGGKPPPSLTPAHAGHRRSLAWKVLLLGAPFVISTEAKLKRKEEGWGVGNGDVAAWSSCMLRNVQKKKAIHKNSH